ncbi:hypothetical protein AgCh_022313 [Apium graveolens]
MVGGLLMKSSSEFMLRRELFNLSPSPAASKPLYIPSARVCFRRNNTYNNNTNNSLGFSALGHKLHNVVLSSSAPHCLPLFRSFENETNPIIVNNQHSVMSVCDKIADIKKKVFKLLASLLLFGFLAFMTSPERSLSAYASTSSSYVSTSTSTSPSSVSTSCTKCDCATHDTICNCDCHLGAILACSLLLTSLLGSVAVFVLFGMSLAFLVASFKVTLILVKLLFIGIALSIMVPPVVALVNGFFYFLQLCKDDKMSVLVLQVGVLDNMRELQTELAQTADTSDAIKLEGVMKSLLQHCDSCHFAHLTVTQCISEEIKYGEDNDEMDSICAADPLAYYIMLKCFMKGLVVVIHSAMKIIKKIHYDGKYSKQLFREVLTTEVVRYDRDEETISNIDGMKYKKKAVGEEHGMVDNNYLVVTMLVLASGIYSVPRLVCNTEHLQTVFKEFNTIPKSKVESVEVFWTQQTGDEVVSKQELQRDFPQLKPINFSGVEELAIIS